MGRTTTTTVRAAAVPETATRSQTMSQTCAPSALMRPSVLATRPHLVARSHMHMDCTAGRRRRRLSAPVLPSVRATWSRREARGLVHMGCTSSRRVRPPSLAAKGKSAKRVLVNGQVSSLAVNDGPPPIQRSQRAKARWCFRHQKV